MMVPCHNHKTRTSDKLKCTGDMVRSFVLYAGPHIRKSLRSENTRGSLQSGMPGSNSETQGRFYEVWAVIWYSILLVLLLPFMAKLLQGSVWTSWVIRYIPWSRYFRAMMWFSKMTLSPFTQLELLSHGFKSILPCQHNHQIWTSLNCSGQFFKARHRFPPPTALKQLQNVLEGNGIKFR
jgi:hypothetical protein